MGRVDRLRRAVKSYDYNLTAKRIGDNRFDIIRKSHLWEVYDLSGRVLLVARPVEQFVVSLTDNWSQSGVPVDWGIEPLLCKIKAMDLASNPELFNDLFKGWDKHAESEEKDFENNVESFLLDFRKQFAKATNDINTSTLNKFDKRRLNHGIGK